MVIVRKDKEMKEDPKKTKDAEEKPAGEPAPLGVTHDPLDPPSEPQSDPVTHDPLEEEE